MSIEQQVRVILGLSVLSGPLLYVWWPQLGLITTAFMGLSLIATGFLNMCGTRALLHHMPWNKPEH
jgi:hypothetical protein